MITKDSLSKRGDKKMTKQKKQIAMSRIKDNPEMYEIWEESDNQTRKFMLLMMVSTKEQLNEVRRYMIKVMNR